MIRDTSLSNLIQDALKDPEEALYQLYGRTFGRVRQRLSNHYQPLTNELILDEDWDILVVLDACRIDTLKETSPFDSEIHAAVTQGPNTGTWYRQNFADMDNDNIIYLSGNPAAADADVANTFFKFEDCYNKYWDDNIKTLNGEGTVDPQKLARTAIYYNKEYPDKRIVAHFLQPHTPFVDTPATPSNAKYNHAGIRKGKVSAEEIMKATSECLDYLSDALREIKKYTDGEILITADHGDALGEIGVYGHPPWARIEQVTKVPRQIIHGDGRNLEIDTLPSNFNNNEGVTRDERLKQLGYLLE